MKYKAICIRCGTFKKDAFATCAACNLTPKTDFEAARALILSLQSSYGNSVIGKTMEELQAISETIRNGKPYPIDGDEQTRVVRAYYTYLNSLPKPKWYQNSKFIWSLALVLLIALITIVVSFYYLK